MNRVELVGRMTADAELKTYEGGERVTFNVAVQKKKKSVDDGKPSADFINCVAFGKNAQNIVKYFKKGQRIGISGRLSSNSYRDKEGKPAYSLCVMVDEWEFVEDKNASGGSGSSAAVDTGFMNIPDGIVEELPFG